MDGKGRAGEGRASPQNINPGYNLGVVKLYRSVNARTKKFIIHSRSFECHWKLQR